MEPLRKLSVNDSEVWKIKGVAVLGILEVSCLLQIVVVQWEASLMGNRRLSLAF